MSRFRSDVLLTLIILIVFIYMILQKDSNQIGLEYNTKNEHYAEIVLKHENILKTINNKQAYVLPYGDNPKNVLENRFVRSTVNEINQNIIKFNWISFANIDKLDKSSDLINKPGVDNKAFVADILSPDEKIEITTYQAEKSSEKIKSISSENLLDKQICNSIFETPIVIPLVDQDLNGFDFHSYLENVNIIKKNMTDFRVFVYLFGKKMFTSVPTLTYARSEWDFGNLFMLGTNDELHFINSIRKTACFKEAYLIVTPQNVNQTKNRIDEISTQYYYNALSQREKKLKIALAYSAKKNPFVHANNHSSKILNIKQIDLYLKRYLGSEYLGLFTTFIQNESIIKQADILVTPFGLNYDVFFNYSKESVKILELYWNCDSLDAKNDKYNIQQVSLPVDLVPDWTISGNFCEYFGSIYSGLTSEVAAKLNCRVKEKNVFSKLFQNNNGFHQNLFGNENRGYFCCSNKLAICDMDVVIDPYEILQSINRYSNGKVKLPNKKKSRIILSDIVFEKTINQPHTFSPSVLKKRQLQGAVFAHYGQSFGRTGNHIRSIANILSISITKKAETLKFDNIWANYIKKYFDYELLISKSKAIGLDVVLGATFSKADNYIHIFKDSSESFYLRTTVGGNDYMTNQLNRIAIRVIASFIRFPRAITSKAIETIKQVKRKYPGKIIVVVHRRKMEKECNKRVNMGTFLCSSKTQGFPWRIASTQEEKSFYSSACNYEYDFVKELLFKDSHIVNPNNPNLLFYMASDREDLPGDLKFSNAAKKDGNEIFEKHDSDIDFDTIFLSYADIHVGNPVSTIDFVVAAWRAGELLEKGYKPNSVSDILASSYPRECYNDFYNDIVYHSVLDY